MSLFYFGGLEDSDSDDDDALPYPKPLARSAFLSANFSPTEFLSTLRNRHQTLEDLRQELRSRSQELNKELLDLVNNNYQDFLGLGDSLKGGEEKVEEIRVGLLGFRREVDTLQQTVSARRDEVAKLIEERHAIVKDHRQGRSLLEIETKLTDLEESLQLKVPRSGEDESLDLDFLDSESDADDDSALSLERLTYRTQQYIQVTRINNKIGLSHPFIVKQEGRMLKIKQTLVLDLNNAMRTIRSTSNRSPDKMLKLLTLYGDLGEKSEALKIAKS